MVAVVELIRDAWPDEASALATLQRRSSDVWEEYRAQLAANPDAIEPPHQAIADRRVRVAVDAVGRRLGFSVVLPITGGRCELDDLFVEPDSMGRGSRPTAGRRRRDARSRRGREPCRRDREPERNGLLRAARLRDHRSGIDSVRRCAADEPRPDAVGLQRVGGPAGLWRMPRRRSRRLDDCAYGH